MDVVVVGAGGLLGQDVVRACKQRGFNVIAPTRVQLDVTSDLSVDKFFVGFRADWIINCAAYVAVDDAEKESDAAFLLNAEAAGKVARAGAQLGARVIQISTDFVFDGRKNRPYIESDEVNPIGVYGASKLGGERRAIQENASAIIARTAWLYGTGRSNFPLKILEAARSGKSLRLVSDRVGSPTYTKDLARALGDVLETNIAGGVYHIVNQGVASWWDFCSHMIQYAGINVEVDKASNSDYPTPAARPMYSVLSTDKLQAAGVPALPTWQSATERFVDELRQIGKI